MINYKIIGIWEGLGNQLFQYAFARMLQEKTENKVYLDVRKDFTKLYRKGGSLTKRACGLGAFQITLPCIYASKVPSLQFLKQESMIQKFQCIAARFGIGKWRLYEEKEARLFKPELSWIKSNVYMKGWFQNEQYFETIRDILLEELQLKHDVKQNITLEKLLQEKNIVSVHIRRGDYIKLGMVLPMAYYQQAVSYMENKLKEPKFLVFADDTAWAKHVFADRQDVFYIGDIENYRDYEELILMSRCKHHIIANSTFSWWGAWLNSNTEKLVVAPRIWDRENPNLTRVAHGFIPKEWVKI